MDLGILFLFIVLFVMVVLFLSEWAPFDLTAMTGLLVLTLTGYIAADQTFRGFSSPAVITMLSTFFLGGALRATGVTTKAASLVKKYTGANEIPNILAVMGLAAVLSAFMNNVAAVAVLLPAANTIASQAQIPPSRLLIPLSFGAIMGGMTTVIGTTPNMIMYDFLVDHGLKPFEFFDFSPIGLLVLLSGVAFIALLGRHALPRRDVRRRAKKADLPKLYKLHDRMVTLKIPEGSRLVGETLESSQVGSLLDAQVLAVIRGSKRKLAPAPQEQLLGGDLLLVRSNLENLERLLSFKDVRVESFEIDQALKVSENMGAFGLKVTGKEFVGASLGDLKFRQRFGFIAAAIQRGDEFLYRRLGQEKLEIGDVIHVIGRFDQTEGIDGTSGLDLVLSDISVPDFLVRHLFAVRIGDQSPLAERSLSESKLGELAGVTVVGRVRGEALELDLTGASKIRSNDVVLMAGERDHIKQLSSLAYLEIVDSEVSSNLESQSIGMLEVVLSPRSGLLGRSLRDVDFREKYGLQVLAIWREGRPIRTRIGSNPLRFGDALLLQGSRKKFPFICDDPDFVVLTEVEPATISSRKGMHAVAAFLAMVVLSAFQIVPVHIAAFLGAVYALVSGSLSMREAYFEVEWRVIFLVACLIPIGSAIENSGAAGLVAQQVLDVVGGFGPLAVLIAISIIASLVSQTLDGSLSVVLLSPISLQIADQLGVSPYPFLMVIALSASVAFMTPFSHKANLLVMGAGGYRSKDYLRVGSILSLIAFAVLWTMVPIFYPFDVSVGQ